MQQETTDLTPPPQADMDGGEWAADTGSGTIDCKENKNVTSRARFHGPPRHGGKCRGAV